MSRSYLLTLKIINSLVFIWILLIFLISIFDFDVVITTADDEFVILSFFNTLKNVFFYLIYGGGVLIAIACAYLTYGINSDPDFIISFFENYLSKWVSISAPELEDIPELIWEQLQGLLGDLYLFIFQILIIISVFYAIRAFLKTDPKYNFFAIGTMILMIIIPLMIIGLRKMLDLFTVSFRFLDEMANPLSKSMSEIPIDNFILFISSPVIIFSIISYIYLEISFQINYADIVTKPSVERSERLEAQLSILARESHYITANVEKIKEEAKQRMQEIEEEQKEGLAVRKFFARSGERFSYVKEMIEKKKLEEEEKKLITAASKTRRLGRYIERLFREDEEARDTLTAKTSAPRSRHLITSTIINFTYRVTILIIISFVIIHPHWFLDTVIQLPDAITESVAMYSPEVIIILLLPITLLFPIISQIISFVKHRNLVIRLKQEGRIKEILASVGDYVKKEEVKEEEEEEKKEEIGEAVAEAT